MTGFIIFGVIAAIVGGALLVFAIRRRGEQRPQDAAMLIGAMMLVAFGLVIAGFAIAYRLAAPLNLNNAEHAR